jgi:hypothetical protein
MFNLIVIHPKEHSAGTLSPASLKVYEISIRHTAPTNNSDQNFKNQYKIQIISIRNCLLQHLRRFETSCGRPHLPEFLNRKAKIRRLVKSCCVGAPKAFYSTDPMASLKND